MDRSRKTLSRCQLRQDQRGLFEYGNPRVRYKLAGKYVRRFLWREWQEARPTESALLCGCLSMAREFGVRAVVVTVKELYIVLLWVS